MRKVSDIWIATTIGFFSAFRDARKKGHELIRAGGQGGHLQPILSAVGQKRPLVVEIKGFKTGHFWEQKSAPLDLGRYGTRGASRTVEAPQSELAGGNLQFTRQRLVSAADSTRAWAQSRDGRPVFALAKTSHFDRRFHLRSERVNANPSPKRSFARWNWV